MKKHYNEKSDVRCSEKGCNRMIRANVADRKDSRVLYCYEHWVARQAARGHYIQGRPRTAEEVENGESG